MNRDHYSYADELAKMRIDPRWEHWKELGNDAFKKGECSLAIQHYGRARSICESPFAQLDALRDLAEEAPNSALAGAMATCLPLSIIEYLPRPIMQERKIEMLGVRKFTLSEPNKPLAICAANTAAALMKLGGEGDLQEALKFAEEATKICPEYVNGHKRLIHIKKALGDAKGAAEVKEALANYVRLTRVLPWNGPALYTVGFIEVFDYQFGYGQARKTKLIGEMLEAIGPSLHSFGCSVSLVPNHGGQWAMLNLKYITSDWEQMKIDALEHSAVDHEGGALLSRPPHGEATPRALANVLKLLPRWLEDLREALGGNEPTSLTCGMGLVHHKDEVEEALKASGFSRVMVMGAISTMTSEDAGLTPRGLF